MITYERIDCSEGVDIDKSEEIIKCMTCNYYYFKDTGFILLVVMIIGSILEILTRKKQ